MARVAVLVPPGATARQLSAVASLCEHLADGQWPHLAESFSRLAAHGTEAAWPEPIAALLRRLVLALREAAAELDGAELVRES
jgi:hypothetical protein